MADKIACCGHDHTPENSAEPAPHVHAHAHEGKQSVCGHDACTATVPATAREPQPDLPNDVQRLRFHVAQMDCPTEEALIRRSLSELPDVLRLDFDLLNRILTIHHRQQNIADIHRKLNAVGMAGTQLDVGQPAATFSEKPSRRQYWKMALGGIAAFSAEVIAWISGKESSIIIGVLALFAILICGIPTLKKGWIALRHFTLNIHLLMTAAVAGAVAIGQWPEAAMVIFLFAVAEMIEAASLIHARNAISGLLEQAPETAQVQQADGSWQAVSTHAIAVGTLVQCRPGDRIALDGFVVSGLSSVNQAAITGESMPVEKQQGDIVYAGTLNQSGTLQIRVSAPANASMLARIAHSVQEAQSQRAPTQSFVDRFASIYTPLVFVLALLTAILPPLFLQQDWHDSLYRALVLLVIACPCALVISTPVTVVSGLALAARHGIVIKGGLFLEQGRLLKTLAFDKTGTLTEGKPGVNLIRSLSDLGEPEILRLAASLDAGSSHPLAVALTAACSENLSAVNNAQLYETQRGRGVSGEINGQLYYLGNRAMLDALSIATPTAGWQNLDAQIHTLEQQGNTVIFLCRQQNLLGLIAISDQVRESSQAAIAELHALGVTTLMLTGDNAATAQAIAAQTGISEVRSQLLPEDKLEAIRTLRAQGVTGMTGDGINDAPAIATAHIGFAMAAGSDTALETADVALMQNDLRKLPEFIRISRKTSQVLWQNISFALAVKLIFFALALSGHASLWMAVFADTGTSLLVVLNGVRLSRYAGKDV
ncbi:heavy metal translocating P-type ATPase [Undibacterium sp. WLX3042]|uniref:heavy metal translocating P-type ATPase n=1 Tax=Undibacterium sp. WLX3042 TaxID=3412686 RepID=UPI003C2CE2D6